MAAMESWFLDSYTNDTWTELASPGSGETVVIRSLIICNTSAGTVEIDVRITQSDGSTVRATQINGYNILADETLIFGPADMMLVLASEEQLQIRASAADVSFSAFGGTE